MLVPPVIEYFLLNKSSSQAEISIKTEIFELSQPDIQKVIIKPSELFRFKFIPIFIYQKVNSLSDPREFTV